MPFACIFVPDFPAQAVFRCEPELAGKPLAILDGAGPIAKVFCANAAARTRGVEIGMTKLQVETCTEIVRRWRSPVQEATAHAALLDCAWTISPRVEDRRGGEENERQDTVVLDITGCEKLFGSSEKIARRLKDLAHEIGLDVHAAVAGNPEAAICAARGFSGISVIPAGREGMRLGVLPLASLGIPQGLLNTLERWGVHSCAEFAALPEIAVVERLGQQGRHWQCIARGSDPRPLIAKDLPVEFEECMELEFPVELLESLMFVLNRLLDQLCARLRMHILAAREVTLTLTLQRSDLRNKEPLLHVRTLRLPVPARESKLLLKLLELDLRAHPPHSSVIGIRVSALPSHPRTSQFGLFSPLRPEPERLEVTLARVANAVGEERVGAPVLLDTHRPNAFAQTHFVLPETPARPSMSQHRSIVALRMFRPPIPAAVDFQEGRPVGILCDEARRCVLAFAGPWRTKGDWWSEKPWARDDWDVLMEALRPKDRRNSEESSAETALYRMYRDIRSERWFIEGVYD